MTVHIVVSYTIFYDQAPEIERVFSTHDGAWAWIQERILSGKTHGITYAIETYGVDE